VQFAGLHTPKRTNDVAASWFVQLVRVGVAPYGLLERIAELHSEQRDYSRERAAARELLDTFPERCS
jgi:hypothetical protein